MCPPTGWEIRPRPRPRPRPVLPGADPLSEETVAPAAATLAFVPGGGAGSRGAWLRPSGDAGPDSSRVWCGGSDRRDTAQDSPRSTVRRGPTPARSTLVMAWPTGAPPRVLRRGTGSFTL